MLLADEAIEYQKTVAMHGLSIPARPSAVWILRELTEWLRFPFAAAAALAHFCSLSKFQIASVLIRTARDGRYWPVSDDSGLVLKMAMI
ncbi:hypothetical protein MA20_12030 [Bradyrhizobium japonicum]|uniref:Uncharacterized protein n=2 Tax=Bradyrhizobium TaxID=374 RepID=A0A0A3Y2J2_BRAJP|nr:hypothetical protein MA20_12030 [Bradyrhizobium japonicum]MDA9497316.1 hypothetical protein [Bradyrhizobium sp. CCBAU 11357]QOZ66371.1 hypothetical protein WN72_08100 [Bradyrhizobium arachidis]